MPTAGRCATALRPRPGRVKPFRRGRCGDAHGFFHGALLVRADGEAEVTGLNVLRVWGQRDAGAGRRDAFDADENVPRNSSFEL